MAGRVDRRHAGAARLGPEVGGDLRERPALRRPEPERLAHRLRRWTKSGSGESEGDPRPLAGELAERHQRLERGDAAAGDQHVGRAVFMVGCACHRDDATRAGPARHPGGLRTAVRVLHVRAAAIA